MIRRTAQFTAAIAGALLLLSACGGSSSSSSASDAATAAPTTSSSGAAVARGGADMTSYRQCMSDNGVTLPDFAVGANGGPGDFPSGMPSGMPTDRPSGMPSGAPPSGGPAGGFAGALPDGVDQETFDAAQAACASLAPQGGFGQRRPGGGAQIDATALAAYKSCLTDHDVAVPDGDNWMASLDRSDQAVQAEMETCAPLLPSPSAPTDASPAATASPAA